MAVKTALYERHVALGGRMVDFAGYSLPVQYPTGPKEEHLRVRQAAGLFDIDHMGQIEVRGPDALAFLQRIMTADVSRFRLGRAYYSLMCYDDGTVVDDTFIYRLQDMYFVVVNASNNAKDTRWMNAHAGDLDVSIANVSEETYMLALQGPASQEIAQGVCSVDLASVRFHRFVVAEVAGTQTLIGRTGYTGENGYEFYFPAEDAISTWDTLMEVGKDHGLLPCGLAARDSLRLEACMPLYGQEISPERTPLEANLAWAVALDKTRFLGRDALLKASLEGPDECLVGFMMKDRGVPRHGYAVALDEEIVGEVTSGIYSPTLDAFVGLAYVPPELAAVGSEWYVVIRDRPLKAVVVDTPFYTPAYRR